MCTDEDSMHAGILRVYKEKNNGVSEEPCGISCLRHIGLETTLLQFNILSTITKKAADKL